MFIVEAKAQDNKKFTDNAQEVCGNLVFINDLNVINYYNLQDTYNTELKIDNKFIKKKIIEIVYNKSKLYFIIFFVN